MKAWDPERLNSRLAKGMTGVISITYHLSAGNIGVMAGMRPEFNPALVYIGARRVESFRSCVLFFQYQYPFLGTSSR
jgi:hypothetical protein